MNIYETRDGIYNSLMQMAVIKDFIAKFDRYHVIISDDYRVIGLVLSPITGHYEIKGVLVVEPQNLEIVPSWEGPYYERCMLI